MEQPEPILPDPAPDATWELWYQDMFDRESRPYVDARGQGFVRGLMELWARHLFETVRADGSKGFSRFHLSWQRGGAAIEGDWQGATRLRAWIFGDKEHAMKGYVAEAEVSLLEPIARVHAHLLIDRQSAAAILDWAAATDDRHRFEAELMTRLSEARPRIIRVTIEDGLAFPSGQTQPAAAVCIQYLNVPARWLAGGDLLDDKKEAVLENLYGPGWRQGNDDGSTYVVHRFETTVLDAGAIHSRAWLTDDDPGARYWFYHVTEDGHFKSVERDVF